MIKKDPWEYAGRMPRYAVTHNKDLRVTLRSATDPDVVTRARLLDFSRGGMCFACDAEFATGGAVLVELAVGTDYLWTSPAQIRWQQQEDDGSTYGCQFAEPVAWEVLGELILREVVEAS
jgi:hypothetical protein